MLNQLSMINYTQKNVSQEKSKASEVYLRSALFVYIC